MDKGKFKALRKRIKYRFLNGFVVFIIAAANLLPLRPWLAICGGIGRLFAFLAPNFRKLAEQHLSIAYAKEKSSREIEQLSRDVFAALGRNAGWVIRSSRYSADKFRRQCQTHGEEHAERAFARGRGVIFLTAHLGPFESIAHELALRGYHPFIVGTPLKDPALNNLLVQNRTRFGAESIERGKDTYRIMKNITSGGTMAILIDQDTSVKSVFVDFFGRPCSTPIGATVLALKTGAAVVPVFARLRDKGKLEINYYPEVELQRTGDEEHDIAINTQTLSTIIEEEIRKYPEQWVWLHRRWKTVPSEVVA